MLAPVNSDVMFSRNTNKENEKIAKIKRVLLAAHDLIPEQVKESDYGFNRDAFWGLFQLGEYLLAMEELDGVIDDNPSPGQEFWDHLITAAETMGHVTSKMRYEYIKSHTT